MSARWALALLALLVACSDDSESPELEDLEISGRVAKGAVVGASVRAHSLGADGRPGDRLAGPLLTDDTGRFSGTLRRFGDEPIVWRAAGGSFVDEVSTESVDLAELGDFFGFSPAGEVVLTPYSTALYRAAVATTDLLDVSARAAYERVGDAFGSAFGFDPWTTAPSVDGDREQKEFAALLGGLCELVATNTQLGGIEDVTNGEFLRALVEDLSDGRLNALSERGELIFLQSSSDPVLFPALDNDGIEPLIDAANRYAGSVAALDGVSIEAASLEIYPSLSGTGGGMLTFSGDGADDLPAKEFEPNSFALEFYELYWESAVLRTRVEVVPSPTKPELAVSVRVLSELNSWLSEDLFDLNGVSGVTIDGTTVLFTGVLLAGTIVTTTELQLDGQLSAERD